MSSEIPFNKSAINVSDCLRKDVDVIGQNYLLYFGMFLVFIVISIAISLIPYAGGFINFFISGPLLCGIFMAILTGYRGEHPAFSMMFEGFSRFLPAFLIQLIQALPWLILGIGAAVFGAFTQFGAPPPSANLQSGPPYGGAPFNFGMLLPFLIIYAVVLIITLILKVLFFFALPLVADRNLGIGDAIKLSFQAAANNIGGIVLVILLEILICMVGFLALCIGIFFVFPFVYGLEIAAYKQVFPDVEKQLFNDEPPSPAAYGGTYGFGQ